MQLAGLFAQVLNGLQYGLLLFLISSGLTLIFGVMRVINLAHGSLFMIGAYLAYALAGITGSLWLALPAALAGGALFGAALEYALFRRFREREHLDQVLLTFALILLFEEARSALVDNQFHSVAIPAVLDFSVRVTADFAYSAYRIAVLGICLGVAALMFIGVERTRVGSAIRAAAENAEMVDLLGIDARRLHTLVFAVGTALAMLAGALSDHIVRAGRDRWARLDRRRILGRTADRPDRHTRQGLRTAGGGHGNLRAHGGGAAVPACGPVRQGLNTCAVLRCGAIFCWRQRRSSSPACHSTPAHITCSSPPLR
jgi:branched-chain amino acid transport system permease protein